MVPPALFDTEDARGATPTSPPIRRSSEELRSGVGDRRGETELERLRESTTAE